jgi:prepilin-type N-terminal cleavage/methylation domain-containing protein
MATPHSPRPRGFTLVELVIAMAMMTGVVALATQALVSIDRDQAVRARVTELQGGARLALGWLQGDLRQASLGAGSGVIWTAASGGRVARPALQIFSSVPGGGSLDVKPGTDAVLAVEAFSTARSATVGELLASTGAIPVTSVAGLAAGDAILMGDYGDASWGVLASVTGGASPQLTLQERSVNVLPGQPVPRLGAGAAVRKARARLYYVDASDVLVRLTLAAPRPPASDAEVLSREELGRGFENMKIECQLDDGGGGFRACPAALDTSDPASAESTHAFGSLQPGQGPVLTAASVPSLRNVIVSVAVRSERPVATTGDPKIALAGVTLPVGGADDAAAYVRRAYRVAVAVRNTSLEAF